MYKKIYNILYNNKEIVYVIFFVIIVIYLSNNSINLCILEKMETKNKKKISSAEKQIEFNDLRDEVNNLKLNFSKINVLKGEAGPRGIRGKRGRPGQNGGTYIFANKPLYYNRTGNLILMKGNTNTGNGTLQMTDKNKFGPQVNWTLTSDNKLKSGDGSCLFVDSNDSLVINSTAKGCSLSSWLYNNKNMLVSKNNQNKILTIDQNKKLVLKDIKSLDDSDMGNWQTWKSQ
jgi:hypothetical protein